MRRRQTRSSSTSKRYRQRTRRHHVESLEARLLLTADPALTDFVVYTAGDLDIHQGLVVEAGFLGAEQQLKLDRNSQTRSLFSGSHLEVSHNNTVEGDVRGNETVDVKHQATILGNVDGGDQIQLHRDVYVSGTVVSADRVDTDSGTVVDGGITEFGNPLAFSFVALPEVTSFTTDPANDVDVERDSTMTLAPGVYGDLEVRRDSTLTLTAGEYFFDEIDVDKDVLLTLDVTSGPISVFVAGDADFGRDLDASVVGGGAEQVYFETHGKFKLKKQTDWWGTIFAPYDKVDIDRNSSITGAIYSGSDVKIDRSSTLNLVPNQRFASDSTAPVIAAGLLNDTGASDQDSITSDPAVTGQVTDESQITDFTVEIVGVAPPTDAIAYVNPLNGTFTLDRAALEFIAGGPLVDGAYNLQLRATDEVGNVSSPTPVAFELDASAPADPVITAFAQDTGRNPTDGVTSDTTLLFSGTAEPGSLVTLSETGLGQVGSTTADAAGNWTIDLSPLSLTDGSYSFSTVATDVAGNTSVPSTLVEVQIDTVAPTAPGITRIDDDTGVDDGDGITNDNALVFAGRAEPGAAVTLSESGLGTIGTAVADALGDWSIDASSAPLPDGSYGFAATAEDLAGNVSDVSITFMVVIDTAAPTPTIDSFTTDTGAAGDGITGDDTLEFVGTAEAAATVTLSENVLGVVGIAIADAQGDWTISPAGFADGSYSFTAVMEDAAGNISAPSAVVGIQIDTQAPVAPTVLSITEDTGSSDADGATNDTTLIVAGTGEVNSQITLSETGLGVVGTAAADALGNWSVDLSATPLADGSYQFTASSSDLAGNTSDASNTLAVQVDTAAPMAPVINSVTDDTGADASDGITSDNTLIVAGTGEVNSQITLSETGLGVVGTAQVDALGNWSVDLSATPLADGSYPFTASSSDLAGNVSSQSVSFFVVVDTVPPTTPTLSLDPAFDSAPLGDNETTQAEVSLIGTTDPFTLVELVETGALTTSDATGDFVFTGVPLNLGVNDFTARATDVAGNTASRTECFTRIDAGGPDTTPPTLSLDFGNNTGNPLDRFTTDPTVVGFATDDSNFAVNLVLVLHQLSGPNRVVELDLTPLVNPDGSFTIDESYLQQAIGGPLPYGYYEFFVDATDAYGNFSFATLIVGHEAPSGNDVFGPLIEVQLANDTAPDTSDGLTTDPTVTGTVFEQSVYNVNLSFFAELTGDAFSVDITNEILPNGTFTLDETFFAAALGTPLPFGLYDLFFQGQDALGNTYFTGTSFGHEPTDGSDVFPPELEVRLAHDDGQGATDGVTSNPTIVGRVSDASNVNLVAEIDFTTSTGFEFEVVDITSLVMPDGSFVIDAAYLASVLTDPLPGGAFDILFRAIDTGGLESFGFLAYTFIDLSADVTPPQLSAGLANDTAVPLDARTADASIEGTASDENFDTLSIQVSGPGVTFSANATSLIEADTSFVIDQSFLMANAGGPLPLGLYEFDLTAVDLAGQSTTVQIIFELVALPNGVAFLGVTRDTGHDGADGITSDNRLLFTGLAPPLANITISETTLGVLGTVQANAWGDWILDARDTLLPDDNYSFLADAGAGSPSTDTLAVTIDTAAPLPPTLQLDPAFDTGMIGDGVTTLAAATLFGVAEPSVQVYLPAAQRSVTSDAAGNFQFTGVTLGLGPTTYTVQAIDAAGNTSDGAATITRDFFFTLNENTDWVTDAAVIVPLGQDEGASRTISFSLSAAFDQTDTTSAVEDTLLVSIVDPLDPDRTLMDGAGDGTAVFALAGANAEFEPGVVSYDGARVEIDVTNITDSPEGLLVFELVNMDADNGTTVDVGQVANLVSATDAANVLFNADLKRLAEIGPAIDTTSLTVNTDVAVEISNPRVDLMPGEYAAEFQLRNRGPAIGRRTVISFPGLPAGVQLQNQSGVDGASVPYINMFDAIRSGGLGKSAASDPVLLVFDNPNLTRFSLTPVVLEGGPNQAPTITPIGPLAVTPGDRLEFTLNGNDADGDRLVYSIRTSAPLPNIEIAASGELLIAPTPDQVGNFTFEVVARDGATESSQTVSLGVVADPVTTTRISGVILDTDEQPLVGVPVELQGLQTTTAADGSFQLEFANPPFDTTLQIRGELITGPETYPFIAEKLKLLLEHDLYDNVDNVIPRPIYLPVLDTANAVTIDPLVDVTVTTPAIPEAAVFVAAGTLRDQNFQLFTGDLSITEVPVDLTPAALPEGADPDLVVTIQPGEMQFLQPAPLTLPNLAGYPAGLKMDLWSINPQTGLFDNVGDGIVSQDGQRIQTVSGGIINSSWHYFIADPSNPEDDDNNEDKRCDDCEQRHDPNADPGDSGDDDAEDPGEPKDESDSRDPTDSPGDSTDPADSRNSDANGNLSASDTEPWYDPIRPTDTSAGGAGGGRRNRPRLGPKPTFGNSRYTVPTIPSDPLTQRPIYTPPTDSVQGNGTQTTESLRQVAAAVAIEPGAEPLTEVVVHSGAVVKEHPLVPYQSLGAWRGLTLVYDSERVDPRPIINFSYDTTTNARFNIPLRMESQTTILQDSAQGTLTPARRTSDTHYFLTPPGAERTAGAIQMGLQDWESGVYGFGTASVFKDPATDVTFGSFTTTEGRVTVINTTDSAFGAGWGLADLHELVEVPDGVLLIDGDGNEFVFDLPEGTLEYIAPPGDFSTLEKLPGGVFRRTMTDQTVYEFEGNGQPGNRRYQLTLIRDRNGNETRFEYNAQRQISKITDPVNLETTFTYINGRVTTITDPANRQTVLDYDANGNLTRITDPDSTFRTFDYDAQHQLNEEINKRGHREEVRYDFAGRVEQIVRKDGSVINYAPAQTRALGSPEQTLDPANPAPAVTTLGAIAQHADANGNVTQTVLDNAAQLVSADDGAGALPSVRRNADNLISRVTDARGNATLRAFDDRGNVVAVSDSVSRASGLGQLYANYGFTTGPDPRQVQYGDVTGDGVADLVTSDGASEGITILPGAGGGSFGEPLFNQRLLEFGQSGTSVAIADFNNDGFNDIYGGYLLLSDGNGGFVVPNAPTGDFQDIPFAQPRYLTAADINADGNTDVVAALGPDPFNPNPDPSEYRLGVSLGNGDATFAEPLYYAAVAGLASLAVVDVDRDGLLDVVTANDKTNDNISILLGNGDGSLQGRIDMTAPGISPDTIVTGDLDSDGNADLIASAADDFAVFLGTGGGRFELPSSYALTNAIANPPESFNSRLTVGDLDSDGDLDVAAAEQAAPGFLTTFLNDGSGTLAVGETVALAVDPVSVVVEDMNADGAPDVALVGNESRAIQIVIGNGDGSFESPPAALPKMNLGTSAVALVTLDANNDGVPDAATANQLAGSVSVALGIGDGTFAAPLTHAAGVTPTAIASADLNEDGNADLVVTNFDADTLSVLLGNGSGGFSLPTPLAVGSGPRDVGIEDVDNDGNLDLVVTGNLAGSGFYSVLLGFGDGTFAAPLDAPVFWAETLDLGDINGDDVIDLVIGQARFQTFADSSDVTAYLGNGDGTFTFSDTELIGIPQDGISPAIGLQLLDLNLDGLLDVVASSSDRNNDAITTFISTEDGNLTDRVSYDVDGTPVSLLVGDLDSDGTEDVVTLHNELDRVSLAFSGADGTLPFHAAIILDDIPAAAAASDLDGDGDLDLLTIGEQDQSISTWLNARLGSDGQYQGVSTIFTHDPVFSQVTEMVDYLGRRTIMQIDPANGNTLSVTRVFGAPGGPDDITTSYTYTPQGLVDTITDPLGRVTDYEYDPLGRRESVTFALGTPDEATQQFEYAAAGNLTATIDELGHRTEFGYDPLNRTTSITEADPDGPGPLASPVTLFDYDDAGNLTLRTDALLNTTVYAYDDKHRLISVTDAHGNPEFYTYEEAGNLATRTDRIGRVTTYSYDDRNRLVETIDPEGFVETYAYDEDDNMALFVDKNGNEWTSTLDSRNRVTSMIDPLGGTIVYGYDVVNNLVSTTDEIGRETTYAYDEYDRIVTKTLPDPDGSVGPDLSPVFDYQYDLASNLRFLTDALGNVTEMVYDDRDRMVQRIDPDPDGAGPLLSPITTIVYDDANRVTSVADPLSRTTSYVYDDLNRLITETYPDPDGPAGPELSPVMTYTYDAVYNERSMTDALGNVTTYDYDMLYRLTTVTEPDPDGAGPLLSPVSTYTYDDASQLISFQDPLNRTTTYAYDGRGLLVGETLPDPDGPAGPDNSPVMSHAYDGVGNELSMTDALNNVTEYEYDAKYRVIRLIEADPDGASGNPITTFVYDDADQLLLTTDPLGRQMTYDYDDLGRVIRETYPDPDGPAGPEVTPVMTHVYDLMDNRLSMTDALGNVTEYTYDNLYRMTASIQEDPDDAGPQTNPTTNYSYDVASQLTAVTDPLNRTSTFEYDNLGRVIRETYPDPDGAGPLLAPEMTYTYDLMNNELSMTDAVGNVTAYVYDNLYRLTDLIEEDPDGAGPLNSPVSHYTFDIASQMLTESDPLDRTNTYEYDDLGRLVRMIQPDPDGAGPLASPEMTYTYDLMNNRLSMTDPLGHVTQYAYDNLYRMTRQIDEDLDGAGPLTHPTTVYTYDLVDNLLSLTDPVGNVTAFAYDDLDRRITETIELGVGNFQSREYAYDLMNNLIRTTDRNERVIENTYDNIYRLVEENWLDGLVTVVHTIQFAFDEASQMLRAEDVTVGSRYDYTYDDLGRVTQTLVNNGGPAVVFTSAYDAQSRLTQHTASVAGVNDYRNIYAYDGLNRLSQLDQTGQVGGSSVADKRIDFGYNADDQFTSLSRYRDLAAGASDLVVQSTYGYDGIGRLSDMTHVNQTSTIADYDWAFDAASRITQSLSSVDGASDYDYDNGNQLTGATHAAQADESYVYDENGNRTVAGYTTGFYNRLSSDGTYNYEYDDEGNRTLRTNIATGEVTEYDWDHRNRLVGVTTRSSLGGPVTQIVVQTYDAFNRWINTIVDTDGAGPQAAETTRYEYEANQIVLTMDGAGAVTNRYLWGPAVDQLLADEQVGNAVYYPVADHLGTIRDILDETGAVANHIIYDAFGNVTSETNASVDEFFGYTGRAFDEATGLQNNLNRWYDADVGRWVSEDPIGFESEDANLFRYVRNASTTAIDPMGMEDLRDQLANALRIARLAEAAYTSAGIVEGSQVGDYSARTVFSDRRSGYRAILFENTQTGEAVMTFAGTETASISTMMKDLVVSSVLSTGHALRGTSPEKLPGYLFNEWGDWLTDAYQGVGGQSRQYERAIRDTSLAKALYGDKLTLTGHSLGGGLASTAALVNELHATTFNPAGVHQNTLRRHGKGFNRAKELINAYKLWADPLTSLQDRLAFLPDTVGTVYEIPTMANGLNYWAKNHGMSRFIQMLDLLLGMKCQ